MTIDWPLLLCAIGLLWVPYPMPQFLHNRLTSNPPARPRPSSVLGMAKVWTNWASLLTAAGGAFLLSGLAIQVDEGAEGVQRIILPIKAGVLGVGILLQMIRFKAEVNLLDPVYYLCGVTLFFYGPISGVFAVVVGWLFALSQNKPGLVLPVAGIALGLAGYLLAESSIFNLAINVGGLLAPIFIALLSQKELIQVSQERASTNI